MKNVLIIGTGSIAQKHIKNLISMNYKISVFSERNRKIKNPKIKKKILYIKNLSDLSKFNFVIIANETNKHLNYIKFCIEKKKDVYFEKPVFHKKYNFIELEKKIKKNNLFFYCGYQLLMHEKIKFLSNFLKKQKILSFVFQVGYDYKKWREGKYTSSRYFLNRSKGGGVIFELIHEINLIQHLIGKIDKIKTLKKSTNSNKFEDLGLSLIKTKNNVNGILYQDMLSSSYFRNYKIICKKCTIELDISKQILKINDKIFKINKKKNSNENLLKESLKNFIKIKRLKKSLRYFKNSVSDLNVALQMHNVNK